VDRSPLPRASSPLRSPGRAGGRPARAALLLATSLGLLLLLLVQAGCSAGPQPTAPPATGPVARPRVLIFGDSYTAGHGATPETQGYAYRVGRPLGWDVTVDGVGGTGYLAVGTNGRNLGTYRTRLAAAPPGPFDVVVLQGSSNDEREPIDALPGALASTVPAFRARYPGARIVMMGPVPTFGPPVATKLAVNDVLKSYAAADGISFIDPIAGSWFGPGEWRRLTNPADGHPNNAGYGRICDRFVIDATRLGLGVRPGGGSAQ